MSDAPAPNRYAGTPSYDPAMMQRLVPAHLRNGLQNYIEFGIPTGSGLRAILEDAPLHNVAILDPQTISGLQGIVRFLHNYAPSACHGSEKTVGLWLELGGLSGLLESETK